MNAIEQLKEDHRRIEALLQRIQGSSDQYERERLFRLIKQELDMHTQVEETVVYPLLQQLNRISSFPPDPVGEHERARSLLRTISRLLPSGDYSQELGELIRCVDRHVREEEKRVFPALERNLDPGRMSRFNSDLEEARRTFATPAAA